MSAWAEADRRVTLRPAPEVMAQLSALLPVKDGVAVVASLKTYADGLVAGGDERTRGQIMADALVAGVTGQGGFDTGSAHAPATGDSEPSARPSTTVNLTVSDRVLLGIEDGDGWVEGYGPVPGDLAREMAADAEWLRRLYLTPDTGDLVTMDSRADLFPAGLALFLRLRDRTCRSRWCDAPIRHADHIVSRAEGGPTSGPNGQGVCEACNSWVEEPRDEASRNHAKAAPGWSARPRPGPRHTVVTRTPTGHTYESTAPPAPRETRPGARLGWKVERLTLTS